MSKTPSKAAPSYASATIKKLDKSRVEITATVATETWEAYRAEAVKRINASITLPGFRKGMVPEGILVAKVGESAVLEEMAELALSRAYLDIILAEKIDAIGKPSIQVTKLASGNPLELVATTAVVPTVTLPDWKSISAKEVSSADTKELEVTPAEIEEAIMKVRRSHASHEGHDHEKMTKEEHDAAIEAALPELTDDFVKTLGDFADVPDFKNKVSDMLAESKRDEARDKLRVRIGEALVNATTLDVPDIMLDSEVDRTQSQFEADISRMGVKLDDYLKHAKKTIEDIRAEWRPHAEKKAKLQLILNAIAETEKITPSADEVEAEVDHIVEHYADADRERAATYATTVLTNEKVFQMLESNK